jgi:hypothetical protein
MPREFEIRREVELEATPEQLWDALTTAAGTASWLFPGLIDAEPRVGGEAGGGHKVTAWDPPRHFAVRAEREDGWFNALEDVIEARGGGRTVLRYVHSGIFVDDWDNQYDAAGTHTDFYLHTLGQYVKHFPGRTATYVTASVDDAAPGVMRRALGVAADAPVGTPVRIDLPGVATVDGVIDYSTPHFLGIRTGDALYRFFDRSAWGAPSQAAHHLFADGVDEPRATQAWQAWLDAAAR